MMTQEGYRSHLFQHTGFADTCQTVCYPPVLSWSSDLINNSASSPLLCLRRGESLAPQILLNCNFHHPIGPTGAEGSCSLAKGAPHLLSYMQSHPLSSKSFSASFRSQIISYRRANGKKGVWKTTGCSCLFTLLQSTFMPPKFHTHSHHLMSTGWLI